MLNRKLHREKWQEFFDKLSKTLQQDEVQRYVMLRVSTPAGLRDVAPWLEFEQISYDPAAATLHVRLDGFERRIDRPILIWAAVEADGNVDRLVVLCDDGTREYIDFSRHRFPYNTVPHYGQPHRLSLAGSGTGRNERRRALWRSLLRHRRAA